MKGILQVNFVKLIFFSCKFLNCEILKESIDAYYAAWEMVFSPI